MRGNSLSIFKPPVFVKTILLSCAFFASMFFNSCKQLTSFDPNVDGVRVAVSNTFSSPTDLKATHGRKQMISLEWTPVSGAKYYDVYCAESATAEFKKIGGTDKNSFDDKVGAGRTLYYRVCATKSDGTQSELSATVKGTSLAQPVISGGDVEADSATISWFMENARAVDGTDNYESSLMFVVHWQQKNGGTPNEEILSAKEDFKNSFYEHKIENLSGAADYEFWIDAYLSGDQSSVESSPRVDKKTLTSYTPLAPVFTASQGESAKGIWLYITLPEKVMVQTETKLNPNEKVDEPYPLYFEIYRKVGEVGEGDSDADWGSPVCKRLYCNGKTTPPTEEEYNAYNAGAEIKWFDESANLVGGEKYTYRIISHSDTENYDKFVCPEGKKNNSVPTPPNKATTALGWKSAHPDFKVKTGEDGGRTLSADKTKVVSVSFGFSAGWKDLGKAGGYKFAIKQNKKPWEENYSGDGEDSWLTKAGGEQFFGTIDEINSCAVKFGSESGLKTDEIGVYSYTLYIVLKNAAIGDVTDGGEKVLDNVKATDEIVVTDVVELPKAELKVQGGYKDKVELTIAFEKDVTYKVVRTRLDTTPQDVKELEIPVPENPGASFEYPDIVEGNGRYSYMLKAIATNGAFSLSPSQEAETLGTPEVSFEKGSLSYDSVTISFDGVLAAEKYTVQLGTSGGFGGGATFDITKSGDGWVKEAKYGDATANVKFEANKFTVTINKPEGYDDATKAGATAKLTVTAHSNVDDAPSEAVQVNVLGPALLNATVNTAAEATENSITLTWKKVDGAKGYLIRRVMYKTADSDEVYDDSEVTYYCDASGENDKFDLADGGRIYGRATISLDGETFTLTDNYMKKDTDDPDLGLYQEAQAKISWGLPFQYVVLPVLEKKDFDFAGSSLELAEGGKVAYKNIKKIETEKAATWGYGLEVHAEKSKSTTEQKITWKKPYYASLQTGRPLRVFKRKAGTTDKFVSVGNVDANGDSFTYEPEADERYEAFEYAVKYDIVDDFNLPDSLNEEFAGNMDSESKTELSNKGYLFTVKDDNIKLCGLSATKGGSNEYAELVEWNGANVRAAWGDYKTRALGPTGVRLYIRNNNLDTEWHRAADIASLDYSGEIAPNSEEDVSANIDSNGVSLYPAFANGETTPGALKVLRDYKHYYALSLTRRVSENDEDSAYVETQKYTPGFGDFVKKKTDGKVDEEENEKLKVFAYRQITDEELVRTATLAMAIGLEYTGTNWETADANFTKTHTHNQGDGVVSAERKGGSSAFTQLEHILKFSNYSTVMKTKSESEATFLTLNGTVTGYTYKGGSSWQRYYPKEYNGTITITFPSEYKDSPSVDMIFFWLGAETEPREPNPKDKGNESRKRGIEIKYPAESQTQTFGNITPLPFLDEHGYLNDTEAWK